MQKLQFIVSTPGETFIKEVNEVEEIFKFIGNDTIEDNAIINHKTSMVASPADTNTMCEMRTHHFMNYALTRPVS